MKRPVSVSTTARSVYQQTSHPFPSSGNVKRPTRFPSRQRRPDGGSREQDPLIGSVLEASDFYERPGKMDKKSEPNLVENLQQAVASGDWPEAFGTAHRLVESSVSINTELLGPLLKGLSKKGYFRMAMDLYNRVEEEKYSLSYNTFHVLIEAAMKSEEYNLGIQLYNDAKTSGYYINQFTYNVLLSGLLRDKRKGSRSHSVAYQIWTEIKDDHKILDLALFRSGCGACVAMGKMEEAESLIPVMRDLGYNVNAKFYGTLIKGYCKLGYMKKACKWYEDMKQSGVGVTAITCNILIQGFVTAGKMDKAVEMLQLAKSDGVTPDVWTYTSLIKGHLQQGRSGAAASLLREFRAAGGKPNLVTYSVLIDGHVKRGDMAASRRLLEQMQQEGINPNRIIFNTLLKGYAKSEGSKERIIQLLGEMKKRRIRPDVDTLNTLLSKLIRVDKTGSVQELFDQISDMGLLPDAVSYNYLLKAAGHEGDVERCKEIFSAMDASSVVVVDAANWNLMVSIFTESGDMETAEQYLNGAVEFSRKRGLPPPVEAFGAIIRGYILRKDHSSAASKFRWFSKIGGRPDRAMLGLLRDNKIPIHCT